MKILQKLVKPLLVSLVLLLIAVVLPMRQVGNDDMAWSIQRGEWVWILPMRVRRGDVVLLRDPLDPQRKVLRRAIANTDQKVRYEDASVRVNGKRIRQTDMGDDGDHRVLKEVIWSSPPARPNPHFIRVVKKPIKWSLPGKVMVPKGSWYLLADNRDEALDSRWWGPVPEDDILGVVRFRLGQADDWREAWQLLLPEE